MAADEAGRVGPTGDALDPGAAALVRLSAALGAGDPSSWRQALREAAGVTDRTAIEETLLQAHLFVGFPIVLEAFVFWRDLEGGEPAGTVSMDLERRREAGEGLCRGVYGKAYERLRDNVRALHPDLDRWMVEEGYGRTLSRPGLRAATRELCIVALLAAAGHDRQLRSHLRGALNLGAGPGQVEAALASGLEAGLGAGSTDGEGAERARFLWGDILGRIA